MMPAPMSATRILASLGLGLALAACNQGGNPPPAASAAPPPKVSVAKPVVKQVTEHDDFTGRFDAVESVEVRARVSGFLDSVAFKDGALVKKGDLLFVIDKRPYQAAVEQAEAAVTSGQSRQSFAQSDLERAQSLDKTGNITEQVLGQRRQSFLTARAEVEGAKAALATARLNLEWTEVRAPIAGRIGRKLISEGNLVAANTTLLTTIVQIDPIYFYFDIDERSYLAYQRISPDHGRSSGRVTGTDVLLGVSDEKEPARKGRLDFIDSRLDQATGTIRGRAVAPNPDLFITPGLFGSIRIPGSAPYQGVLVPDEAIGTDQSRRFVWVVAEDGTPSSRVVVPGPRIDGYRVIRKGLTGEETIVVNGLQRVRPGAKVAPEMQELPPTRAAEAPSASKG